MRILTLAMLFPNGAQAEVVHRTDFPAASSVPEWTGDTSALPPELLTEARTQDGLAARCYAVADELGATVSAFVDGGYRYAD